MLNKQEQAIEKEIRELLAGIANLRRAFRETAPKRAEGMSSAEYADCLSEYWRGVNERIREIQREVWKMSMRPPRRQGKSR